MPAHLPLFGAIFKKDFFFHFYDTYFNKIYKKKTYEYVYISRLNFLIHFSDVVIHTFMNHILKKSFEK